MKELISELEKEDKINHRKIYRKHRRQYVQEIRRNPHIFLAQEAMKSGASWHLSQQDYLQYK